MPPKQQTPRQGGRGGAHGRGGNSSQGGDSARGGRGSARGGRGPGRSRSRRRQQRSDRRRDGEAAAEPTDDGANDSQDTESQDGDGPDGPETQRQLFGATPTRTQTPAHDDAPDGSQGGDAQTGAEANAGLNADVSETSTTQEQPQLQQASSPQAQPTQRVEQPTMSGQPQQQNSTISSSTVTQPPSNSGAPNGNEIGAYDDDAYAALLARVLNSGTPGTTTSQDTLPLDLDTPPPTRLAFEEVRMMCRGEYICNDLRTEFVFDEFGHLLHDIDGSEEELRQYYDGLGREAKGIMVCWLTELPSDSFLTRKIEIFENKTPARVFGTIERLAEIFHDQMVAHYGHERYTTRFDITREQLVEYVQYWAPGSMHDLEESLCILWKQKSPPRPATFGSDRARDANGRPIGPGARAYDTAHGHLDPKTKDSLRAKTPSKSEVNKQAAKIFADSIVRPNGNMKTTNIETVRQTLEKMSKVLCWHSPHEVISFLQSYSAFVEQFSNSGRVVMPPGDTAYGEIDGVASPFPLPSKSSTTAAHKKVAAANFDEARRMAADIKPTSQDVLAAYAWNYGNELLGAILKESVTIIKQRLQNTALQSQANTLEAVVGRMTALRTDKPVWGLHYMDHSRPDIKEDLARMLAAGAGSLALGIFAEIYVKLLTVDPSGIMTEVPDFVVDVKNGCVLPADSTCYDVLNSVKLQTIANMKDPRHHNRLFVHPALLQLATETFFTGHVTAECGDRSDFTEMDDNLIAHIKNFDNMTIDLDGESIVVSQVDRFIAMLIHQRISAGVGVPWGNPSEVITAMQAAEPNCLDGIDFLHDIAAVLHDEKKIRAGVAKQPGKKPRTRGSAPFDAGNNGSGIASMALSLGDAGDPNDAQANAANGRPEGTPFKPETSGPFSSDHTNEARSKAKKRYSAMAPMALWDQLTGNNGAWNGPKILRPFFDINDGKLTRTVVGGPKVKTSVWYDQAKLDKSERLILNKSCTPDNWYVLCRARALQRTQSSKTGQKEANLALEHDVRDAAPISETQWNAFKATWVAAKPDKSNRQRSTTPSDTSTANKAYDERVKNYLNEFRLDEKAKKEAKAQLAKEEAAAAAASGSGTTTTELASGGGGD